MKSARFPYFRRILNGITTPWIRFPSGGTPVGYLQPRTSPKIYGFALLLGFLYFSVFFYKIFFFTHTVILVPYFVLMSFLILARFPLAVAYRPQKFSDNVYTPSVTVVIPTYNEEQAIGETVRALIESDYPQNLLEVFVYNDGSTDGTRRAIYECINSLGYGLEDRREIESMVTSQYSKPSSAAITFCDCSVNRGKREGLYNGFKDAKGELVMVIDSDTIVERDCIRELVKPLQDPKYAAASGHTDIKNMNTFIGKMQQANYFISYHLAKKSEALMANVTCLPGCGSVYRKEALATFIGEWRNQRFLGVKCTYGEDRGLTTLLLKRGYNAVYTPAAVARTICPDNLKKLWKQRIRWKKSFLRECIWQAKFMYKRPLGAAILFYVMFATSVLSPFFTLFYLFIAPAFFGYQIAVLYILGICLITLLYAFYAKIYSSFPLSWTLAWFLFNTVVLSFGTLYAWFFSIRNPKWETR